MNKDWLKIGIGCLLLIELCLMLKKIKRDGNVPQNYMPKSKDM